MTGDGDVPMDSMTTLEYEIPAAHPAYVAELGSHRDPGPGPLSKVCLRSQRKHAYPLMLLLISSI